MKALPCIKNSLILVLLLAGGVSVLTGDEYISYTGGVYQQNFNSLVTSNQGGEAVPEPLSDPGPFPLRDLSWSTRMQAIQKNMGGWQVYTAAGTGGVFYIGDDGIGGVSGAKSFGIAGETERALGSVGGIVRLMSFGVVLKNDSEQPISALQVSYTGEQWRAGRASDTPDILLFEYALTDTPSIAAEMTAYPALDFTTPILGGVLGPLDGNDPVNQEVLSSELVLNWQSGQYLVLRWRDQNESGADHGIAIDDLRVSLPGADLPQWNNSMFMEFELVDGWRRTPIGWFKDDNYPWIYNASNNKWYWVGDFGTHWSFYAYDSAAGGWIYTSTMYGGWYYSYVTESWQNFSD